MEAPYIYYYDGAGPTGPMPKAGNWNELAQKLRAQNLVEEAGSMVGHMVASAGDNSPTAIRDAGNNFTDAIQPPLTGDERRVFMAGIEGAVAVNAVIGEA